MTVRLLPPAEEEMAETALYYEAARIGLGAAFLDELLRVLVAVREYPESGTDVGRGLRRLVLPRFPFSVIYAVGDVDVLVVAIAHQSRRPEYWRGRA